MSSLIFSTNETQAMIATDTLAVYVGGEPCKFTSKAIAIPHLRMVIAGTGAGGFLDWWFVLINTELIVRGIDDLDQFTQRNLMALWSRYKVERKIIDESMTVTVYHFGVSGGGSQIRSIAYRSLNGFKSETVPNGSVGRKPDCVVPDPYAFPDDFKSMMREQRSLESQKSAEDRVYIGGEIIVHHLTLDGCLAWVLDRFEDFDKVEAEVLAQRRP